MSDWQKIETAPKDGTDILACEDNFMVPAVIYWNDSPAWNCWCLSSVLLSLGDVVLTHWMPLPSPPQDDK